jgi:hypothetical protein
MKGNGLLLGIVVVLLITTSVLPGCNKEQPTELVVPSSSTPVDVFNEMANAGPYVCPLPFWQDTWSAEYMRSDFMPEGALEEQFIEGYYAILPELFYTKRDGERVGCGFYKIVSLIVILKYEDIEPTEKSFINISETQELHDSTYGGIALKNGTHSLDEWKEAEIKIGLWDESVVPCYVIHSGCFVIYFYGRDDVTNDMLDRIIAAFGVKE